MHDIRAIRADPAAFDAAMARRGLPPCAEEILALDKIRRDRLTQAQEAQAKRHALSRQIGQLRRQGADTATLESESASLAGLIEVDQRGAADINGQIKAILEGLPNILDADVPDGPDETANRVLKEWGEKRDFGFAPKQHFELGEALGMMDFATAAKLAGARFTLLRGPLARLERAIGQFMLDLHTREHGYEEVIPPLLVNAATCYGTGQLPKFEADLFKTDDLYLIPTAEVPLTNMVAGEIVAEKRLPIRLTALTECFRSEAGAAGKDTRGYLRQHEFRKVELVSICHPDGSDAEHERMTTCAERVLELLDLRYRRVVLSSGDTGFGAAKTYDLEVWLPGQGAWREISSCSNTRAFQARRMGARFRSADGRSVAYVHTLNGSGVALGRTLIAVMESYQQADGSILVPEPLAPYMGGVERIACS
jgi:seryl-tRNA synthetase